MEADNPKTMTELTFANVSNFLQTVVLVDDKAHFVSFEGDHARHSLPVIDDEGDECPVGANHKLVSPPLDSPDSSVDPEDLDAKSLIDGFVEEGIACTVLRPSPDDDVVAKASRIAEFADIVVLDWILDRDDGTRASDLIRAIIEKESGRDRMRLIAIYTGERDLRNVANRIAQILSDCFGVDSKRPSDFVATNGPVRVAAFAKEHTPTPIGDRDLSKRKVRIKELPRRLIREFAEMTTGLLPNIAIAGLSEVRVKTHKLLTMFSRSLDPAYLGHRALLSDPSEAEEQAIAMLVSEVQSILEHGRVAEKASIHSIRAWFNEMKLNESLRPSKLALNSEDCLLRLLEGGIDNTSGVSLGGWKWERVTHAFTPHDQIADEANRKFARMMHVKTRYGGPPPTLTLGTILFLEMEQDSSYWICLQPKCDSVRINRLTFFPMVELTSVTSQRDDFEIVVCHRDSWALLRVPLKPNGLRMFPFEPCDIPMKQVTASQSGSNWLLNSANGTSFEWVAQLKDEHAQRIVNEFASSFSRVGTNESEWVRRSGSKR